MTPSQAEEWLDAISGRGWRLTLERVQEALGRLGNPQQDVPAIHVTGTNGKGSCCAFIEAILRAAGQKTGCFSSPHLTRLEERIRIQGQPCEREALAAWLGVLRGVLDDGLPVTYFEALTVAAFLGFSRSAVEMAVIEVGLGGRLDATRSCEARVTIITNVSLDHTKILGSSPALIAREKAGILRQNIPLVTAARGDALTVLEEESARMAAPLHRLDREFSMRQEANGSWQYRSPGWELGGLQLGLPGRHQAENAACALRAVELLATEGSTISPEHAAEGLAKAQLAGRLSRHHFADGQAELILDCAHNPAAARALCASLQEAAPRAGYHLIYGVLRDKDSAGILTALAPVVKACTLVQVDAGARTQSAETLRSVATQSLPGVPIHQLDDPVAALQNLVDKSPVDLLVTGSLYLVGTVLKALETGRIWPEAPPRAKLP